MPEYTDYSDYRSLKGERTISQGFIAQYAAEAAAQVPGVASLDSGLVVSFKEALGVEHYGKGVRVRFDRDDSALVNIDIYPVLYYGDILPDVAWEIQRTVKDLVESYTGLSVHSVNVQVMGIVERKKADELVETDH